MISILDETNRILSESVFVGNRYETLTASLNKCVIDGDIFEFGVYVGTTINLIASYFPYKTIYGFDSFLGLPTDWNGTCKKGCFSTDGKKPKVLPNVKLIEGWFGGDQDVLKPFLTSYNKDKISFIHIDCDVYYSTKAILDSMKRFFTPGLVIQFDELIRCDNSQNHELKAWVEFINDNNIQYQYLYKSDECQISLVIK